MSVQQKSHINLVKDFTEESSGVKCPEEPKVATLEELTWISKMVMSELHELLCTKTETPQEAEELLKKCIGTDLNHNYVKPKTDIEICAEQMDALVDVEYYMNNFACKKGMNLEKVFQEVHKANMMKKFPDGTFHLRSDGKVLKPENHKEADITKVAKNMSIYGSWS